MKSYCCGDKVLVKIKKVTQHAIITGNSQQKGKYLAITSSDGKKIEISSSNILKNK